MPKKKIKKKSTRKLSDLKAPLYTWASPLNAKWVKMTAVKKDISYSRLIDTLITQARSRG